MIRELYAQLDDEKSVDALIENLSGKIDPDVRIWATLTDKFLASDACWKRFTASDVPWASEPLNRSFSRQLLVPKPEVKPTPAKKG